MRFFIVYTKKLTNILKGDEKMKRSHKWRISIATILIFTLIFLSGENILYAATKESQKETEANAKLSHYTMKGDLSVEELSVRELPESDRPEVLTKNELKSRGSVNRLRDQEMDLNSVIFQNKDGNKTYYYFSTPVKYKTGSGEIKDKSNKLYTTTREKYAYTNSNNDINVYFPINIKDGVLLEHDDICISMAPLSAKGVDARQATAIKQSLKALNDETKDNIYYNNVFGDNTAIRYSVNFEGYKEDIILYKNIGVNEFAFSLKTGIHEAVLEDGEVHIVDAKTKETIGVIPPIYMYDSFGGDSTEPSAHESYNNSFSIEKLSNGEYLITITVDKDFLNDRTTVYPVYIDPSYKDVTYDGVKVLNDTTIYSGYNTIDGSCQWFYTAAYPNRGEARILYTMTNLKTRLMEAGVTSSMITSASLWIYNTNAAYMGSSTIRVSSCTQAWDESSIYSPSLWNAYSSSLYTDKLINGTSNQFYNINILNIVTAWMNGAANYGLHIRDLSPTLYTKAFASVDNADASVRPYISVDYTIDQTPGINDGQIYYIKNASSGKYLDPTTSNGVSGSSWAKQKSFAGSQQEWQAIYLGDGYYRLRPIYYGSARSLDGRSTCVAGANTIVYTNDGSLEQQWRIIQQSDGSYKLYPRRNESICMSTGGAINGATDSDQVALAVPDTLDSKQNWIFCSINNIISGEEYYGATVNGSDSFYKFIAPTTGNYVFTTTGYTDIYGELYQNSTFIADNDDDGVMGTNFKINYSLTAGQEYTLKIRGYSTITSGDYMVLAIRGWPTVVQPTINSRSAWGARVPNSGIPTRTSVARRIVFHHSATNFTSTNRTDIINEIKRIQNYHMDSEGKVDIAYNYIIDPAGGIWEARDLKYMSSHVDTWQEYGVDIGVLILGDFEPRLINPFPNTLNQAQKDAMISLSKWLCYDLGLLRINVSGAYAPISMHLEFNDTVCPGEKAAPWIRDELRPLINSWGS